MINTSWVVSASLSGSNTGLSLPYMPNLSGAAYSPGGALNFTVEDLDRYSIQVFITGSNVTGTLAIQQSSNCAGWVTFVTASINSGSYRADNFFSMFENAWAYTRILWSGSAGPSSSLSAILAGHGYARIR